MYPQKLVEIVEFLQKDNLKLSQKSRDGRINSALNEDEILDIINFGFKINRQKVRDWIDFSIEIGNIYYPVNIKVTTTTTTDNLNCKLGIYYALTGMQPNFSNDIQWPNYFKILSEHLQENDKDYYFLVVSKTDLNDIFLTSLKTLQELTPNGNNLPFQANWEKNRKGVLRTYDEAKEFILSNFAKSLKLRAKAYQSFLNFFPKYQ